MLSLIQRVTRASVEVEGRVVGEIGDGLLALVGVEPGDGPTQVQRMAQKLLGYRIFADDDGKMNRSVTDTGGGLLLVPQFTLAADTRSGNRPSFTPAAPPAEGERLFDYMLARAQTLHTPVAAGRFGADMLVSLTNDGPVTIWLRYPYAAPAAG